MNILVAMSGGVDSSVAAKLLHEAGHRVIGVTLRLMKQETGFGCCGSTKDIDDARAVCAQAGFAHYVMDFSDTFRDNVMDAFVDDYLSGRTPNPCIACNRFVKFDALLAKALALGADAVATGHYARVDSVQVGDRPVYRLLRAVDSAKDQSYVLHHLGQSQLSRLLFPLGGMTKPEVREAARRWGLKTADKSESMEICFVPGADTGAFVSDHARTTGRSVDTLAPGPMKDVAGRLLGTHRGVARYTRGQRSGLGSFGKPMYVVDIDAATNTLIIGEDTETLSPGFDVGDVHWTNGVAPQEPLDVLVQIRSHHRAAPARVTPRPDGVWVETTVPQRAVTPGQAAVFYVGEELVGGGVIRHAPIASAVERRVLS
jgi:tRNA-specific 2-thiouridylase